MTENRIKTAEPILERYRKLLLVNGEFRTADLESELKDCWKMGYQSLKDVMIDMLKNDRFRLVAARYMEQTNGSGVVSEFQLPLAGLYGIKHFHDAAKEPAKRSFWDRELGKLRLSPCQRRALIQLGSQSPLEAVQADDLEHLQSLGLVYKRDDGVFDFTDDGEDAYHREADGQK